MKKILVLFYAVIVLVTLLPAIAKTPITKANEFTTKLNKYTETRATERVYLHLDKPLYKPGETIWFQAYLRDEASMEPAKKSQILHIEFINPKGSVEKKLQLIAKNGTAPGNIDLSEDIVGGLYKIKAYSHWQKNDKNNLLFEREILIQQVILPRLKMKLDFQREAYGPGDQVSAKLKLESLSNQPLVKKKFRFITYIKGRKLVEKSAKTNKKGIAEIRFQLPKELKDSDGLLNVMIPHQGQTESISRSIPILLNTVKLEFFPEGGDLVTGLPGRVAFRALNEHNKPADIEGIVLDKNDKQISNFSSFHQGMGAFSFTPKNNQHYRVKITKPQGIKKTFELPEALPKGYSMSVSTTKPDKLAVTVTSTQKEKLTIVAQVRGKPYFSKQIKGKVTYIPLKTFPVGVIHITLFDSKKIERAERLVFHYSAKKLNIKITTDKKKYLPREKVTMHIQATDERGIPMPASLSLSVTDDKLISFADDKSGHILSKLLLEPDLKSEVYEPNFYFDLNEVNAKAAMDYLMLTQGWRRFTWEQVLDQKEFTPGFQAEGTVISGKVSLHDGKPVADAEVMIQSTKETYKTDAEGYFRISNLDLYKIQHLSVKKGDLVSHPVTVNNYNEFVNIIIYNRRLPWPRVRAQKFDNEIPMAAPPAMAAGAIEENFKQQELRKEQAKPILKDKKAKAGVVKPVLKQQPIKKAELKGKIRANKRLMADRDMIAQEPAPNLGRIAPRPQIKQKKVIYVRARDFPKVNYIKKQKVKVRSDFRSTIYWQGEVKLDRKGKTKIVFYNSDEITAFRTVVEGVATDGLVGRQEHLHYTQLPFSMTAKIPLEVTMGDRVELPLTLSNRSDNRIEGAIEFILPKAWKPVSPLPTKIRLKSNASQTLYPKFEIHNQPGKDQLQIRFTSEIDQDAFIREVNVVPKGFPVSLAISGQEHEKEFVIETDNIIKGTLQANLTAYPSNISNLLAGIESILREPYGCFEQTSSSTYPNIMILDFLNQTDFDKPVVYKRAKKLIDKGYKKLVSFETKRKGYEWFGQAPGHEALTAYGLMEFADMSKVHNQVSPEMIKRTADWLLSRKDGKGGFSKNKRALDSFGRANDDITNAYIIYALSEAGFQFEIRNELQKAYDKSIQSKDPYQMGLITNALFNLKDKRAEGLLKQLIKLQQSDGSWQGASHSITRSTGKALTIESTSLAVLAILKSKNINHNKLKTAVGFIVGSRTPGGGFANTQSTVMALKALTQYAKFAKRTDEPGTIEIYVEGRKVAKYDYAAGTHEAIIIDDLQKHLKQGKQKILVKFVGAKNALPYTFNVNYSTHLPPTSKQTKVQLTTKLNKIKIKMGETTRLDINMKNITKEGQPMNLAIIGIPGGMSAQPWQLKEMQENKLVDFFEITGNNVVLYYRQMKPEESKTIHLDLKAEIPGKYEAAASRSYLYYTNEFKHWAKGLQVEVVKP